MLSQNDKIFFDEKFFEDCEMVVKKFVALDGQLKVKATITSKISEVPEGSEKPANDEFPVLYEFHANFVSLIFNLCNIV